LERQTAETDRDAGHPTLNVYEPLRITLRAGAYATFDIGFASRALTNAPVTSVLITSGGPHLIFE
jgi:hypothetical protein